MGKSSFRIFSLILISALICTIFTGCFDRREVDELAYVMAIGLDKGKTNDVKMTLQMAVPLAFGSGNEGGGEGDKSVLVTTIETPSLLSGLNMTNSFLSKQINLSHAKVIVFSEELAKEGIQKYINSLERFRDVRGNTYLVVSKVSAEEYLRSIKPVLEVNPAKFFELNLTSFRYTSFTAGSQLLDFFLQQTSSGSQAVVTLASTGKYESSDEFDLKGSTYREKGRDNPLEGDFKAGYIPRVGDIKSEIMGVAVFDGGKMVGELDGAETTNYLIINGKFKNFYYTLPDPLFEEEYIVINVNPGRAPSYRVNMVGEKPVIDLDIKLEGDIISIQSGENYENVDSLPILEKAVEKFMKKDMLNFLYKTSREFNCDICGFGKHMKKKFLDWNEWEKFDWLSKYKYAEFNVNIDFKVRRPGLIVQSVPVYTSEGKVVPSD